MPELFYYFKIHCVGTKNVGKTSIVQRFITKEWKPEYKMNGVEYSFCQRYHNEGKTFVHYNVIDVPDMKVIEFSNRAFLHNSAACIFVFDVCNRETLEEITLWQEEMAYIGRKSPVQTFILVGHNINTENRER